VRGGSIGWERCCCDICKAPFPVRRERGLLSIMGACIWEISLSYGYNKKPNLHSAEGKEGAAAEWEGDKGRCK
jgi:hypothetical protein